MGSKLIWEELHESGCVVDALGGRGEGAYATTICQDCPNAQMYTDPAMYSSVVRLLACWQASKGKTLLHVHGTKFFHP